ncbi:hypothetical protein HanPSC8_Chr17g0778791 [Helianthus annuus]|nr:hypothetical protein HanPSC8_Chr17g0778791 [Helianthus annuus]
MIIYIHNSTQNKPSLSLRSSAEHPLSIHHIFELPSSHSKFTQTSRIPYKEAWCNGRRRTSLSCFYPPFLRLDSSLASS